MKNTTNLPTLYIAPNDKLPDLDQWVNRFEIRSESSGRIYIVSQNKAKRYWGCSCPGWRTNRKCKHLETLALPIKERPYEVQLRSK